MLEELNDAENEELDDSEETVDPTVHERLRLERRIVHSHRKSTLISIRFLLRTVRSLDTGISDVRRDLTRETAIIRDIIRQLHEKPMLARREFIC